MRGTMDVPQIPGWATYMFGFGEGSEVSGSVELELESERKVLTHGAVLGRLDVNARRSVRRFEDS